MTSKNQDPGVDHSSGRAPAPKIQVSEKHLNAAFLSVAVLLAALAGWELVVSYEQQLSSTRQTLRNYATITESALDATLGRIDSSLHYWAIALSERPERLNADVDTFLQRRKEVLADVPGLAIRVLDEKGNVLNADPQESARNFADTDWFKVIGSLPRFESVVSDPFEIPGKPGAYAVILARRIGSADGAFLGAIAASIEARYLSRVRAELDLGVNGSFTIASGNALRYLDHYPSIPWLSGSLLSRYEDIAEHDDGPELTISRSRVDGMERLTAVIWLSSYRIFVAIGKDMSSIMAPWREQFLIYVGGLCTIFAAGASLLARHRRHLRELAENQTALANERFRMRQIIDNAPAVLYTGRAGDSLAATFISPGIEITGFQPDAFTRDAGFWLERIHPDDRDQVLKTQSQLAKRKTIVREYRFRRADGIYHWLRDQVSMITDSHGRATAVIGFLQDVNHEVSTRERFELLYDAINRTAIISTTDRHGRITHANDRFCEVSGYSHEEILGNTHHLLNSGHHDREFFQGMWTALKSNQVWRGEIKNRRKDGSYYWVDTSISPYYAGTMGDTTFIAISFEVTEQKELREILMTSSKLSALGEMAGGVAHEINNPVAIIISKCRMLQRRLEAGTFEKAAMLSDLKKIEETGNRIARIVKGLRTFARNGESDPFESVELGQIISDTVELCAERFKHHSVELRLNAIAQATIECQPVEISQIILNLLNNAHDAVESLDERWVEIATQIESDDVIISVTDSGRGIAPDIATKMMQPFFTTKSVGRGTGLGLSVSGGIAKNHHGQLYYDAKSAHTRFVLKLPITQAQGLKKAI